MQRHIDAHDISGAVTLVARKGQIAWFHAQGLMDVEASKPMQTGRLLPRLLDVEARLRRGYPDAA
jgi:hypothetical protein